MRPRDLFVRCLAERRDGVWLAFCLDFDLAVQGDSLKDVQQKLHHQIGEYLYDALAGQDRAHAEMLLNRRAPSSLYVKWHLYRLLGQLHFATQQVKAFFEVSPLKPDCPKIA